MAHIDLSQNSVDTAVRTGRPAARTSVRAAGDWKRSRAAVPVLILAAGVLFFAVTSPRGVPSVLLIAGFAMAGGILYALLRLIMFASGLETRLSIGRRRSVLAAATILPVLLLMLQSIGQLTVQGTLALCGLFALGYFYVGRMLHRQ